MVVFCEATAVEATSQNTTDEIASELIFSNIVQQVSIVVEAEIAWENADEVNVEIAPINIYLQYNQWMNLQLEIFR